MTVAELIKELEKMPQDKIVCDASYYEYYGCMYCEKEDCVIIDQL